MTELWIDIPLFEKHYQVSDLGRVRSIKKGGTNLLKQSDNNGYKDVRLRIGPVRMKFWVHRLVAMSFIPNPGNLPYVNHKDRDRHNNTVLNLEWVLPAENTAHWRNIEKEAPCDIPF